MDKSSKKAKYVGLAVSRVLSWLSVIVSLAVLIMEMLSSFRFYVTDIFSSPKTLLITLFITFIIWMIKSIFESLQYPSYRIYVGIFFVLSVVSGYLLTTRII